MKAIFTKLSLVQKPDSAIVQFQQFCRACLGKPEIIFLMLREQGFFDFT
jgi:hypothetical protein